MAERNVKLDVIRGIATIIVLAGHTLQVYSDCSSNLLYNIITSVQMPLFMIVSGFAMGYSREIIQFSDYLSFIKKRSLSLLLPWFTWSVLVYFMLIDATVLEHIKYSIYHMESAFWFLFSLWSICLYFGLSLWLSNLFNRRFRLFLVPLFTFISASVLLLIGTKTGLTFLGIKYTVYYTPFFLIGWLVCYIVKNHAIMSMPAGGGKRFLDVVFLFSVILFGIAVSKVSIVDVPDTIFYILFRFFVSLIGCFIIIYFVYNSNSKFLYSNVMKSFGTHSLEFYVIQYILINIFVKPASLSINSTEGFVIWSIYFVLVALMCYCVIRILSSTLITRKVFFGKTK